MVVRWGSCFAAIACAALFVLWSLRWPLVGDASLMHYVAFLMDRGMIPYRDIVDVNMPGTYGIEWLVMHVLGQGALAWRLFDVALGCGILGAMVLVAWPVDRLAGVFAGAIFFLIHGRDGIAELGQRDFLMAALLLWSTALLMWALRKRELLFLTIGGAVAGFCVTVKPTAAVFWPAMLLCVLLSRDGSPWKRRLFLFAGLGPFLVAPLTVALYLYRLHALLAFWSTITELDAYHNALSRVPTAYFLEHPIPSSLLPLSLIAFVVLCLRERNNPSMLSRDELLLAAGVCCGTLSFWVQGKGYSYHRYPADAFLILLASVILFPAVNGLQNKQPIAVAAALGLIAGAFVLAPQCLLRARQLRSSPNDFSTLLQKDLNSLGGRALDGRVQCIDFTGGCVTTLYRMKLEQSTGFLYDCYAYGSAENRQVRDYRQAFWKSLMKHPPLVMIVSSEDCGQPGSFAKMNRWPALAFMIHNRYVLDKEVDPPDAIRWARQPEPSPRYRIYLLRNGPIT